MTDGNYGGGRNRGNRGNRNRGGGGGSNRGGKGRGGRQKRPLLTSAINAAGLSLVALLAVNPEDVVELSLYNLLAACVTVFALSSIISYFAQRTKKAWVEKVSDVFFLIGALIFVWIGLLSSGFLASLGV